MPKAEQGLSTTRPSHRNGHEEISEMGRHAREIAELRQRESKIADAIELAQGAIEKLPKTATAETRCGLRDKVMELEAAEHFARMKRDALEAFLPFLPAQNLEDITTLVRLVRQEVDSALHCYVDPLYHADTETEYREIASRPHSPPDFDGITRYNEARRRIQILMQAIHARMHAIAPSPIGEPWDGGLGDESLQEACQKAAEGIKASKGGAHGQA